VRKHSPEADRWKQIKLMVFDAPLVKAKFSLRVKAIKHELAKAPNSNAKMVVQRNCKDKEHLQELMEEILQGKGEGVMIKDPESKYEGKRSYSLLKVKRFEDAEATVIGHAKGTGRCLSMCGAIIVREKDGTEFKIGSGFTDAQRRKPPSKGKVVTFKF
jgi:DNA ligase 1